MIVQVLQALGDWSDYLTGVFTGLFIGMVFLYHTVDRILDNIDAAIEKGVRQGLETKSERAIREFWEERSQ